MNIDNFCNLGAALQNKQIEVGKQPQIFFYRSNEDSIYEMLSEGYFNALNLRVAKDDLILLYSPRDEQKVFVKVVSNSGGIVQITKISEDDFQRDEMPIPSIEHLNKIVQYIGNTTSEYTNGFFYKCVRTEESVYNWDNIIVQDSYLKNESDNRFVHKTGEEAISGVKSFVDGIITPTINNGSTLIVPNKTGTLATKDEVDLAANSGRMITNQGVWYAKMYSASEVPTADNGTTYADFSQVDAQDNPIIVIYDRVNDAWVQRETIIPPTEYDGYVAITNKIWDIPEQAGQQGGRILWNHQSKEFTPYPQIISFENANLTGISTAPTPTDDSPSNQIANKEYVDNHSGSNGASLPFFTPIRFSSKPNDVSWVNSANYSWLYRSTYKGAYNELLRLYQPTGSFDAGDTYYTITFSDGEILTTDVLVASGTVSDLQTWATNQGYTTTGSTIDELVVSKTLTAETETIAGTTITFYRCYDEKKIILPAEEANSTAIYNTTGTAEYFLLDTTNQRFKLPRERSKKIIRSVRNEDGTWYDLYADGRVEQGGYNFLTSFVQNSFFTQALSIPMADKEYEVILNFESKDSQYHAGTNLFLFSDNYTTTTFNYAARGGNNENYKVSSSWEVKGQSAENLSEDILYFYLGTADVDNLKKIAGIKAETINKKADEDLNNVTVPHLVSRTIENGITIERYSDGYVCMRGKNAGNNTWGLATITLPVEMADTDYYINISTGVETSAFTESSTASTRGSTRDSYNKDTITTTSFQIQSNNDAMWEVKGMAAN